jgi:PPOX class probable F420-dependent enzyme
MPNGQPQATPVWCEWDGTHILINTAKGRQKDENVRNNPKVAVVAIDPENPYRYLEVRGEVVEITEEGGMEHIDKLAKMYVGKDKYYGEVAPAEAAEGVTREIIKIEPQHTSSMG